MNKQLLTEAINKENVIVFFYADWCGGCKAAQPLVNQIVGKLNFRTIKYWRFKVPQAPLNMSQRPAQVYTALQQALGGQSLKSMGGVVDRSSYGATLNNVVDADSSIITLAGNGLRLQSKIDANTRVIVPFGNFNYHAVDLERLGSSLFSGTNTRATGINLELTIATTLTESVQCFAWALSDCILKVDVATKQIEVLI